MNEVFKPKLFSLIRSGIDKNQIVQDIFAGIVVGIVALPLTIAFAVASGASPEKGIITGVVAGFLISFFGGSRVQIGGPTGAFIIIVYGIIEQYGINGLIISTMMAGVLLIAFGLLKLGTLLKFIPNPLVVGFTSGIALVIFTTQIKDAFGLEIESMPADFIDKWMVYFSSINSLNPTAIILTISTIVITLFSGRFIPKIPGSFLAIILITVTVQLFELPVKTIESFYGEIPGNFSFSFPELDFSDLAVYISPAITIAILGGIESLLSAVVADGMISGKHRSNTELIAQGIANIITPIFGGIPATGAIARTATNIKNGGRTPIAGIVHALMLLVIMLFLGKLAKLIPMACLAGILIVVAYNMSEWRSFISICKGSIFDVIVLVVTFLLTVLVDLTIAIEVGIVLASLLFMKRMADISEKRIEHIVDTDLIEDYSSLPKEVAVYEISGPFFFASARTYSEVIETIGMKNKVLIIRMRHVSFIDHTAIHNLKSTIKRLKHHQVHIILSGVNKDVLKDMEKNGIVLLIGKDQIFGPYEEALLHANRYIADKY